MPLVETAARLAKSVPVNSVRTGGAYTCLGLALLFIAVTLYQIVGFFYFLFTGDLLGDLTAREMEWREVGSVVLGSLIFVGLLLAGAFYLLPYEPDDADGDANPLSNGSTSARTESTRTPPLSVPPAPAPHQVKPSDRTRAHARKAEAPTHPPGREEQERDDANLKIVRTDPQLAAVANLLEGLLFEQERRANLQATAMEHRGRRRDYVLLGVGTVAGVVSPVVSAPLFRLAPF